MKNENILHAARRRSLLFAAAASALGLPLLGACAPSSARRTPPASTRVEFTRRLAGLESSAGGRIGVCAFAVADAAADDIHLHYRADERFPLCSTFKMFAAAAILKRGMDDGAFPQRRILYRREDLISHSPVTEKHVADGMTLRELCAAAVRQSDNTAANLLLNALGGPEALTAFARSIGDEAFRLDRREPELNSALPGDPRDTTTPAAMAQSLRRLVLGDILAAPEREQLQTWLTGSVTGGARIRAAAPAGWTVGGKTGTGAYGTTNDIGVLWPPAGTSGKPIVAAIYFTQNEKNAPPRDDVVATAARLLIGALA